MTSLFDLDKISSHLFKILPTMIRIFNHIHYKQLDNA